MERKVLYSYLKEHRWNLKKLCEVYLSITSILKRFVKPIFFEMAHLKALSSLSKENIKELKCKNNTLNISKVILCKIPADSYNIPVLTLSEESIEI